MSTANLPAQFADLEELAADGWCLATETERNHKRHESSPAVLRVFYERVSPRLEDVIEYLNEQPLESLEGADEKLLYLLLAMAEVSFAVEKFGGDESTYTGMSSDRFVAAHDLAEGGLPLPGTYRPAPTSS
jgi:hypothetical protein